MKGVSITEKIFTLPALTAQVKEWKNEGRKVAFTNGVFDLLHKGHIFSLSQAAEQGDVLIIGLNADSSVKKMKGNDRPVNDQDARALILASLSIIDAVVIFEEETPLNLIKTLLPDVLIKGGDYTIDQIAGAKEVVMNGGKVVINPIIEGYSTSAIIQAIRK